MTFHFFVEFSLAFLRYLYYWYTNNMRLAKNFYPYFSRQEGQVLNYVELQEHGKSLCIFRCCLQYYRFILNITSSLVTMLLTNEYFEETLEPLDRNMTPLENSSNHGCSNAVNLLLYTTFPCLHLFIFSAC